MSSAPRPRVSIIIPNYNHARFLRRRIESVLRQTYQDFELILLDDCSTDESRSILAEHCDSPRVRIEVNDKNSGSTFKQWNKGLRLARGEYVWIAESDDFADERLLKQLVTVLEENPATTFAYCRSHRVYESGQQDGFADFYLPKESRSQWTADFCVDGHKLCEEHLVHANAVPNASAVVFRRIIFERVGGADENFRLCGDWKLWAAMALEGNVTYLSEALNYFRCHASSVSNTTSAAQYVAESLEVVRWILDRVPVPETTLETIRGNASSGWVGAVMSLHVPLGMKRRVLRDAKAIDPRALRRTWGPALTIMRLKFLKHWKEASSLLCA